MDRKQLEDVLSTYSEVSEHDWLYNYSHVALNDQNGTIKLIDGATINWLVRPGGLAVLTFQDGKKIFLVKDRGITIDGSGQKTAQ